MRLVWIAIVALCLMGAGKAAPKSTPKANVVDLSAEDLKKIQADLEKLNHLSVKFEQQVYTPLRKKTITYSGDAEFSRPAKFRWLQAKPVPKQVIYNGRDLYTYLPEQKVAYKFSAKGSQANEIEKLAGIVLSVNTLLDMYHLVDAQYDTVNKVVAMNLKPKSSNEIEAVKVEVETLKDYIKKVQLSYKDGKVITYKFSSPKRTPIPASHFAFDKPKGVKLDVFD